MAIGILYREELRALVRGRFAWLGAGVILLAVGGLATVATQDTWLDGYGIVAYFLVPLAFLPFAAGAMSSPRATRFVESVFTAPVERRDWFVAKFLVLLTAAVAYYVALLPMMLVYVHHVGMAPLLARFLLWTPGLLLTSVVIGTLVGILFVGDSLVPPVATSMGLLLAYAGLAPLQELLVAQGNGATRTGHVVLLSPAVLLKNALHFTLVAANIPTTTTATWASLGVVTIGALAVAAWAFLWAQGVETWEATRGERLAIAISLAAIALCPILIADTNYDTPSPAATRAPAIRGLFARAGTNIALATPRGGFPPRCCGTILNRDAPIGTDTRSTRDLLILLPVDAGQSVVNLDAQVTGDAGLKVETESGATSTEKTERHTYEGDSGPAMPDGRHLSTGWVARVPIALTPTAPWDLGGMRYPMHVNVTYHVAGDDRPRTISATTAVEAQVSSAIYEMAVAGGLFPLLCFGAAFRRWRHTR